MNAERQESVSQTRNSELRRRTAGATGAVAKFLHTRFPRLKANHISAAGSMGVLLGAAIATARQEEIKRNPSEALLPLAVIGVSSLLDAVDGQKARIEKIENPNGQKVDVLNDRGQEIGTAFLRAAAAHRRGDRLGRNLALATAATSTLPSLARARVESLGHPTPEGGKLGYLGTRVGRAATGTGATVFSEIRGIPVQSVLDGITTASNLITAGSRAWTLFENRNNPPVLSPQVQKESAERARLLVGVAGAAGIAAGASAIIYSRLRR
ncbi:MAG: hypothetical protein HY431_01485 [Candidatus Levybacteria bacterium]|nr:hypothetical protein [Candidatus Levybacteria bacterium]